MDMSEAVIDNITKLFRSNEDEENELLGDPICNFKHYLIEYLIKTGWNGWLIVTKYLGGVIRKSILNEVIDYCNYVQCPDKGKSKTLPLWFSKLHHDTIFLLLVVSRHFCLIPCLSERIGLSYDVDMMSNTLAILATEPTQDFKTILNGYARVEPFPKVVSGHQSILDTLFSIYVACHPIKNKDVRDLVSLLKHDTRLNIRLLKMLERMRVTKKIDEGGNQDAGNCVLNEGGASWVLKRCSTTKLVDPSKGEENGKVEEGRGGGNQEVQNCLDILERCIEENEKAMMCRSNEGMITSFEECCKEEYDEEKVGMIKKDH